MKALIIGFGQDAKVLILGLKKRNIKFKILARTSSQLDYFIPRYLKREDLIFGDASNLNNLLLIFKNNNFTHVFNVAANSYVQESYTNFDQFLKSNTFILTNLISLNEKLYNFWLYHPISSEIYARKNNKNYIQPRNAYGLSKVCEYYISNIAKKNGINVFFPILHNHESCFRSQKFFTAKILHFLNSKKKKELFIWNVESKRDWGSAFQFMDLIIKAAEINKIGPGELGTSKYYSVRKFINLALKIKKIKYVFYKCKNLSYWDLEDGRKICETKKDPEDEKRLVFANKKEVKLTFGETNLLHGKTLINKLLEEIKKYNDNNL